MKKLSSRLLLTVAALALVLGGTLASQAAPFVWNVATPGANNWNAPANWNPNGVAGTADTNIFGTVGTSPNVTTINNVVSASTTISALLYTNTAATGTAFHVTQIPAGVTLTVGTNLSVSAPGAADAVVTYAAMTDAGTLLVNGNTLNVQDNGNTASTAIATLDLSALSNFVYAASGGTISVAGGSATRVGGVLILAGGSNNITAGTINFGTGSGAQAGSGSSAIKLGSGTNNINVGALNIINNKNSGTVSFQTANGGLRLRGVGGTDNDRATIVIGNRNQTGTGTTTGNLSLSGHPVDIKAGTVTLASDLVSGGNAAVGTFSFNQGIVDATTINMAASGNAAVLGSTGTMTVGTTGTLVVNTVSLVNETVAQTTGTATGNLIVTNGGALICSNGIVKTTALGVGNIIFSSASVNMVGGTIGTVATPVDNLSITNTTLNLSVAVNNTPTNVAVSTLNVGAAPSTINISSLPPIGSYPAQFRLINYSIGNGTVTAFNLGTLPGTFTGYISNNTSSIDLVITNGPTPPPASKAVAWDGEVSGDWDTTTTNWTQAGILTNYNNVTASGFGDTVTFDDTLLGTTNVNLAQIVSPGGITVNNSLSNYVFTGSGKITGPIGLTKQGTGSLTFANAAANDFSGPLTLTGGTLVYDQSVDATVANLISGSGSIVKNNVNTLTLSAINNGFLGGVTVNAGTLRLTATNAAGVTTPIVVNNATLVIGATNLNGITLSNATMGVANSDFLMAANKELTISANSTNLLMASDPQSPTTSRNIEVDGVLRGSGTIVVANANGITSPDGNQGVRFRNTTTSSDFSGTIIVTNNSKSEMLLQGPGPFSPVGTGKFILYAGLYDGNNTLTCPSIGGYLEFNFRNTGSTTAANDFQIVGNGAVVFNGLGSPNGAVTTLGNLKIGNNQELIGYRAAATTTNSLQFNTITLTGGNATFSPHSSSFGVAGQAGTDFSLGSITEQTAGSGITMGGRGNLTLTGANTYTGNTSITNGVLFLTGSASIATSPNIVVASNAVFNVSALTTPFTLGAAQTLSNLNSTAVIAGNADASLGTLSLKYAASTPSFTIASGALTLAGTSTINVNNTGAALAKGSYKIISASGGSVAGTVPSAVTVSGAGIATAVAPSLQITSSELYLVVPNSPPVIAHIVTNAAPGSSILQIAISDLKTAAGWSDADNDTVTFNGVSPTSNLGNAVTQDGTFISYSAPATSVEDFFTYTVTDGTVTTQGTVYIEVIAATPPPPATANSIVTDANGVPTISFTGAPNSTNVLQASTNLLDWTSISTNVADGSGLWQVTDPDAINFVNRFYRSYQPFP